MKNRPYSKLSRKKRTKQRTKKIQKPKTPYKHYIGRKVPTIM